MIDTRREQSFKALFWAYSTWVCLLSVSIGRGPNALAVKQAAPNLAEAQALHLLVQVAPEDSFGVTSTLIVGRTEAILIDTQYHISEASKLADRIAASGRRLKAIFITHPDEDHYFGSAVIHQRFPDAPIYMTADALAHFDATSSRKLASAKKYAPTEIPDSLPRPTVLPQTRLTVDGEVIEIVPDLQGDVLERTNSFVWIPSLRAVIAGDILFNGVHVYLADSNQESRREWRNSIDRIASLKPTAVVAGHKRNPDTPDDPAALGFTHDYMEQFEAARNSASTADDMIATMKKRFPDAASEYLLLLSARKAFASNLPSAFVGFQQVTVPDPQGKDLLVGIWHPTKAIPSRAVLGLFEQSVATNADVSGDNLPLILISHGTSGSLSSHYDTALALAEAGFVVAAPTHTGDNFQDQSFTGKPRNLIDRPRQLKLVTDYMLAVWSGHGSLDVRRVGIFGFSLGGFTALVGAGGVPKLQLMQQLCSERPDAPECLFVKSRGGDVRAPVTLDPSWVVDPRIRAAAVAAPAVAFMFRDGGLRDVHIPVQLWRAEKDQQAPDAWNSAILRQELPSKPEEHVVKDADHFVFLAPCSTALMQAVPSICHDPTGFDRAAFHRSFNAEIVAFFKRSLPAR